MFPEFMEQNIVVVSPQLNLMPACRPNDLVIDHWDVQKKPEQYANDFFGFALVHYLLGMQEAMMKKSNFDCRDFVSRMSLQNLERRLHHSTQNLNF